MSKSLLVKVLGDLTESAPAPKTGSNIESRKSDWKEAVESFDIDRLLAIQDEMDSFIDKMKVISKRDSSEIDLTPDETKDLMVEYLSSKNISEFLDARKAMVRELVFQVVEERLRKEGSEDPENTSGEITVPQLGKRFCKEGAGYADPTLDMGKLKGLLGDKISQVTVTKIIPEQRVEEIDEELLIELAQSDNSVREAIQNSVVPGKRKNPRLNVRDIK